jgi:2-polyprenyl-3-methyl-5-hydroxy-6-metoxy-1,4-benzoquinol methylase
MENKKKSLINRIYNKPLFVANVRASLNHDPYLKYLNIKGQEKGKHLDIGAGNGQNLFFSESFGLQAIGIEYDQDYCHLINNGKVICATSDHEPFQQNCFSVISLMHVLEHLPMYKDTLLEIRRLLQSEGYFIVEVPNKHTLQELTNFFYTRIILNETNKHLGHCNYFTYKSLRNLLENSGFEIIDDWITGGLLSSTYCSILRNLLRIWLITIHRRSLNEEDNEAIRNLQNLSILSSLNKVDQRINKKTFQFVEFFGFVCKVKKYEILNA